jgi:3-hydroxyisobutyrate dehydrogenase-like beta-hydroxyacid dehydrogenase
LTLAEPIVYSYWTVSASQHPRAAVGVIGLGNMGSAIAERLLEAGYALRVHNRSRGKAASLAGQGATVAESAGELAASVDIVLTSLPDDGAFEAVATDVAAAASPGAVLVDLSTVSPAASARVAALADEASMLYLRAPVSGNPSVVRAGNLGFIVSGPDDAFAPAESVLLAIGPTIHRVGDAEEARIVKLAINLVIAGLAQLMAESLVLAEGSGVSRAALLETMGDSAAGAPFVKYKTEPLLRDDYSATFTTTLMEKDVDLVLEAAESAGVRLPLALDIKRLLRSAIEAGYGDDDFMAVFPNLQSSAGREVMR